jgi:hypothetical protein
MKNMLKKALDIELLPVTSALIRAERRRCKPSDQPMVANAPLHYHYSILSNSCDPCMTSSPHPKLLKDPNDKVTLKPLARARNVTIGQLTALTIRKCKHKQGKDGYDVHFSYHSRLLRFSGDCKSLADATKSTTHHTSTLPLATARTMDTNWS